MYDDQGSDADPTSVGGPTLEEAQAIELAVQEYRTLLKSDTGGPRRKGEATIRTYSSIIRGMLRSGLKRFGQISWRNAAAAFVQDSAEMNYGTWRSSKAALWAAATHFDLPIGLKYEIQKTECENFTKDTREAMRRKMGFDPASRCAIRQKLFDPEFTSDLGPFASCVSPEITRPHAEAADCLYDLTLKLGLRPLEWINSKTSVEQGSKWLVVQNSARSERNRGFRRLGLNNLSKEDQETVEGLSGGASDSPEEWKEYCAYIDRIMLQASVAIWPDDHSRRFDLGNARHQFVANARLEYAETEVAALLGYSHVTDLRRYSDIQQAERTKHWPDDIKDEVIDALPMPDPKAVKLVTDRSRAAPRREIPKLMTAYHLKQVYGPGKKNGTRS